MPMRRQFVRIPFETGAVLVYQNVNIEATLIDISLTGALVHCQRADEIRGDCILAIPLSTHVMLSFHAQVQHCSHDRLGCRFVGMSPATFSHLVRLLELNTFEEGRIERELQSLARQPRLESAAAH
jgi:hypothetical protein